MALKPKAVNLITLAMLVGVITYGFWKEDIVQNPLQKRHPSQEALKAEITFKEALADPRYADGLTRTYTDVVVLWMPPDTYTPEEFEKNKSAQWFGSITPLSPVRSYNPTRAQPISALVSVANSRILQEGFLTRVRGKLHRCTGTTFEQVTVLEADAFLIKGQENISDLGYRTHEEKFPPFFIQLHDDAVECVRKGNEPKPQAVEKVPPPKQSIALEYAFDEPGSEAIRTFTRVFVIKKIKPGVALIASLNPTRGKETVPRFAIAHIPDPAVFKMLAAGTDIDVQGTLKFCQSLTLQPVLRIDSLTVQQVGFETTAREWVKEEDAQLILKKPCS